MCTMNPDLTAGQRLMAESRHMGVEAKVAADKLDRLEAENDKLRELARRNWFIALSERDALRIYGVDPVEEHYITALDKEISESMATMQELGIEV